MESIDDVNENCFVFRDLVISGYLSVRITWPLTCVGIEVREKGGEGAKGGEREEVEREGKDRGNGEREVGREKGGREGVERERKDKEGV